MKTLSLGFSPCPNDTFIFYALVHGKIDTEKFRLRERLLDVEALNVMAQKGELDFTKVSYHAFGNFRGEYALLRSGGALGRGCGPLIVSKKYSSVDELKGKRIAIPGRMTTANLLLLLYGPSFKENVVEMRFDLVPQAVKDGVVDAGLIIHEGRFTYQNYGLAKLMDLGEWWEKETGLPIPLGAIIAKRSLGKDTINKIDFLIKESVRYAFKNRSEPLGYIKKHAQELDDRVIQEHIGLYVNDFSMDIGDEGTKAVNTLFRMAEERGIIKKSAMPLFAEYNTEEQI